MPNDLVEKFSSHLKSVLTRALCFAVETNEQIIQPEHLLWALSTEKGCLAAELLKKAGLKQVELRKLVGATPLSEQAPFPQNSLSLKLSDSAKRIVEKAVLAANTFGHSYIGTEHLLSGILSAPSETIQYFFAAQKTDVSVLLQHTNIVLKNTSKFPEFVDGIPATQTQPATETKPTLPESEAEKFPALLYFGRELTSSEVQKRIDPVIGREMEIERLMEILCRRTKNNPMLLGEPGVGKTAVVEGLAKQIFEGTVPPVLQKKRIFTIDMTLVVAGTMYRGEFEARLRQIIDEAQKAEEVILFIDEIHTIVGAGAAAGSMDAANILKPALARGSLHCIGATTPTEFKKHIETDSALERRFQPVFVDEPDEQKAIEILQGIAPHYEAFHRVRIAPDAIEHAVLLSSRYIQDRKLPDKAIDLLDEASSRARIKRADFGPTEHQRVFEHELELLHKAKRDAVAQERFADAILLKEDEERLRARMETSQQSAESEIATIISAKDVAEVISRMLNIALEDLLHTDDSAQHLETTLASHVLGQDSVIASVAGALRRAKMGIAHPKRPLSSFLFLGPSGVGKTELAKAIAKTFFHDEKHLIRLDMSEYSEGFTMSKLIGAPAGYVGYKENANLTDRVRQKPYSVVLFDEIEKAHRDVQNLLLQILEEGEVQDATGRLVNFKNTIVILTSNVGLEQFDRNQMGFSSGDVVTRPTLSKDIRKELEERFRPELLNRIDETCLFEPLSLPVLETICKKQLSELMNRIKTHGITLTFSDSVVKFILDHVDIKFGARTIRHQIQKRVETVLATHMMKKKSSGAWNLSCSGKSLRLEKAK